MSRNGKAFFFGSFEPGNSITLDKLPGFLWPQAVSARLFGFHPWALALPQVIEGALSVLVLFRLVCRQAGAHAALVAAAAFASTPAATGLFRSAVEDAPFTLLLLLAADAAFRAAGTARLRPLIWSAVWVGLAFQTKMLEAWALGPVLAGVFLIAAPTTLRRRVAGTAVAAAVTLAVSASWVLVVALIPAGDRPYIDGTTNNSPVSMVAGYNFLNRFPQLGLTPADTGSVNSVPSGPAAKGSSGGGPGPAAATGDEGGWTKMVRAPLASQTGWLYPAAALTVGCGLVWLRQRPRTDPQRAALLLWGGWLTTFLAVFSAGTVAGHTYYMGVVAAPLAALTGIGTVQCWRAHQAGGSRAWTLSALIGGTAVWGTVVAGAWPRFWPGLGFAVLVLCVAALVLLAWSRPSGGAPPHRVGHRAAVAGLLVGLTAILLAPAAWSVSVVMPRYSQSAKGTVGPDSDADRTRLRAPAVAAPGDRTAAPGPRARRRLLSYLQTNRSGTDYLVATASWNIASPYLRATGDAVLPIGGYMGQAPSPTPGEIQQYVATGRLRYVLLRPVHRGASATPAARVASWVRTSCARVPDSAYGGTVTDATDGAPLQLYRCAPTR
ncbi:glycosyltransferase family 39 protein [Streptomyces sp. RKAG293]|uniref:ArnT family glycosyltransferase n=1 Tax=Streptomyces sp. RKAG293 TaxID=2893403 RepID=UPI002555B99B|nr:glycosyltransferase family 39 protein [Streptomyces sp. RKAG293]